MDKNNDQGFLHRQQMRQYLKRDIANAKSHNFILGFKISGRHDIACPRSGGFCGAFLPDELPNLYPDDCPDEHACCCINHEFVMHGDGSLEEAKLLERLSESPPVKSSELPLPIAVAIETEEPKTVSFNYAEVRVLRKILQTPSPFVWDEKGHWTYETGYPSEELLVRLIGNEWLREATLPEVLMKLTTIPRLKEICVQCSLPRSGDKKMLAERVATLASDQAKSITSGVHVIAITDLGRENMGLQSGYANQQELKTDEDQRGKAYQKLIFYAQHIEGAKIQVNANSWSSCEKLPQIVGVYAPSKAPWLPLGDCPQKGRKPCSCWNASIIEAYPVADEPEKFHESPIHAVADIEVKQPADHGPKIPISWIFGVVAFAWFLYSIVKK